jgi:hypothetical protein
MTDFKISTYIISILIFTFIIMGGLSLISIFRAVDPGIVDDDKLAAFNDTFNVMDDVTSEVDSLESGITDASVDEGEFGVLNALIAGAWQNLKLIGASFSFMDAVFGGLETMFGVPWWIPVIIGSIITVGILFAIWGAIFQRDL